MPNILVSAGEVSGDLHGSYLVNELNDSDKAAIVIAGVPIRNDNLAASFRSQPNNNKEEIVIPDLETPGIMAND